MAQGKVCMAADVTVVAMTPDLGAEVRGVDLSAPLSDACFARIREAFHRYCVIFLRNQTPDPRFLARFAARFGDAEATPLSKQALAGLPQIGVLGERAETEGCESVYWHSDRSCEPAPPAATLLYGAHAPEGVSTEFVNMYSVFNALNDDQRLLLEKLRGLHGLDWKGVGAPADAAASQAAGAAQRAAEHPLVRVHPSTGKKALYLGKDVVSRTAALSSAEARKLLAQLEAFATQPRFVYSHRWRAGDVLVWDNRCTLHRMLGSEHAPSRTLYRIWLKGEVPIAA
jgi:taurine dioxygenase